MKCNKIFTVWVGKKRLAICAMDPDLFQKALGAIR